MKDYGKNKGSSHLKYWGVNNLYAWAMSQKFTVNYFAWVISIQLRFYRKRYKESDEGYFVEVDV